MQTFVPLVTSFAETAKVLDNKRLNKQALEGWQILMTLLELDPQGNVRIPKGWVNHPAVKMWRGHETTLYEYILEMVYEWKARGFNSTIADKAHGTMMAAIALGKLDGPTTLPYWMSDRVLFREITASHRIALLAKDYDWYKQFNWPEDTGVAPTEYTYIWPV